MGLPEGWTKYGTDGEEILSSHRYRALGNAIALPCAEYIMAGIVEALIKGGAIALKKYRRGRCAV